MSDYGFTKDTQVLTVRGWVDIEDIKEGDLCLSYSIENGFIVHDKVVEVKVLTKTEVLETSHKLCSFLHGKDQKWYGWKRLWAKRGTPRQKSYCVFSIPEATQEFNIICAARYRCSSSKVTKQEAAFIGWLLSDGYYRWSKDTKRTSSSFGKKRGVIGMIAQAQHKFYKEVEEVIDGVGLTYTVHEDNTGIKTSPVNKYYFKSTEFRDFMDRVVVERLPKAEIDWCSHLLRYGHEEIYEYLYHFWLADGDTYNSTFGEKKTVITQNSGSVSESVTLAMFLQGRRVSTSYKDKNKKCKTLRMMRSGHLTLQETSSKHKLTSDTYDLLTENGTYIIRQGGHISITCSSAF